MSRIDLMTLAEEERTDLLALLQGLTDDQWNSQSLCTEWRVRDVATHVVSYDELSTPALVSTFLRGGLRVSGVDLPRTIPHHRLVPVLDFALTAPTLPARKHAKDLELTATDVEWSVGEGPEVRGPGEALLMAMAGRPQALDELDGPGLATLRRRVE